MASRPGLGSSYVVQCDGAEIRTVEGRGMDTLHPLQQPSGTTTARSGFCTPGFLMLAVAVLEDDPRRRGRVEGGDVIQPVPPH